MTLIEVVRQYDLKNTRAIRNVWTKSDDWGMIISDDNYEYRLGFLSSKGFRLDKWVKIALDES